MDPLTLSAIIGLVGSLASGGISLWNSHRQAKQANENIEKQNQDQLAYADYQYGKQVEQWNREVEYNTPLNQMQRYVDAGLNPNLIYSQGNPGNSSVSTPSITTPNLSYAKQKTVIPDFANIVLPMMSQYIGITKGSEETKNLATQRALLNAQANKVLSEISLIAENTNSAKIKNELYKAQWEVEKQLKEAQIGKYQSDADKTNLEKEALQKRSDFRNSLEKITMKIPKTGIPMVDDALEAITIGLTEALGNVIF